MFRRVKSAGRRLGCYQILNRPNIRKVTVHMFNPFLTDLVLAAFLGQCGEMVTAARYINYPMGFWTGRWQFQALLYSELDGPCVLKHPPAFFSLSGDCGYCTTLCNQLSTESIEPVLEPATISVARGA